MPDSALNLEWREGNDIALLHNGGEFFPALCKAIDQAQRYVHLETYIFNLDDTGTCVLQALQNACRRGVKVRVVIDGFGSWENMQHLRARLAAMGARFRIYRPEPSGLARARFNLRRLRRLHRKTVVIDRAVAFVGGINILDDYVDVPDDGQGARPRFDFAVRIEGPLVADVSRAQRALWLRMAWRRRDDWAAFYQRLKRWREWRLRRDRSLPAPVEKGIKAVLLLRDNLRHRHTIENVYLGTLARAQSDVLIANAYFFPGRRLRKALVDAAQRGVRVRLLLQGRSEYPMQYRACRYTYDSLIDQGIEIHEYMASYLHAKVAVIDDYAMVGSANMDPFSLLLAREANVYLHDPAFSADLRRAIEEELQRDSVPVTAERLRKRSWVGRLIDWFAWRMLRAGVAITGKASEY